MRTKQIPAIVMLSAGFVTCMIGIFEGTEFFAFVKTLFIVLLIFYILGCVIANIIQKNFTPHGEAEDAKETAEQDEEEMKDKQDTDEENAEVENIDADKEEQ